MATKSEQIQNLVKAFGGNPRSSTIEDAIEDLVAALPMKSEVETKEEFLFKDVVRDTYNSCQMGQITWNNLIPEGEIKNFNENTDYVLSVKVTDKEYVVPMNLWNSNTRIMSTAGKPYLQTVEVEIIDSAYSVYIIPDATGSLEINPYSMLRDNPVTFTFKAVETKETITHLDPKFMPESMDYIVLNSSTADSTKKFKVTVDDTGVLSATEITE